MKLRIFVICCVCTMLFATLFLIERFEFEDKTACSHSKLQNNSKFVHAFHCVQNRAQFSDKSGSSHRKQARLERVDFDDYESHMISEKDGAMAVGFTRVLDKVLDNMTTPSGDIRYSPDVEKIFQTSSAHNLSAPALELSAAEESAPLPGALASLIRSDNLPAPALTLPAAEEIVPLPGALALLIRSARQLKVYVPTFIQELMNYTHYAARHPGIKFVYAPNNPPLLAAVEDWLWIHNEYMAPNYLMRRIHHDRKMFTNNKSEADLCVLSCDDSETEFVPDPHDGIGGEQHRYPKFLVMPGSEWKFSGCNCVSIYLEGRAHGCGMPVPYFHSVYSPSVSALPPWNINANRKNLLCFVGARKRGPCPGRESWNSSGCDKVRFTVLETLFALSAAKNSSLEAVGDTRTLFASESPMWLQQAGMWDQSFFGRAWGMYADSVFSYQPAGDTATRRAFYDSWMLGCIPVISENSAKHTYQEIFRGLIFSLAGLKIEDVIVVLPDEVMLRGDLILAKLSEISEEEIRQRRRHLQSLAPLIQWGWESEGDALTMAFASVMTPDKSF